MSEIERRALLAVVGVGAIAALSKAGPLDPPAGPVTPSGRTTDEIYNRIPSGGAGDGRIALSTSASSYNITSPGSYVLTGDLSTAGTPLTISADNVTIDLNGFTITSTNLTANVVSINGTRSDIAIRNGTISGGNLGIGAGTVNRMLLEDLRVVGAKSVGISVVLAPRSCTLRRCTVVDTGITTTAADGGIAIQGILLNGSGHRVEDCTVSRLFWNGGGAPIYRGINLSSPLQFGNLVSRCLVTHDAALTGQGLTLSSGTSVYRDNTVVGFSVPYSIGAGNVNGNGNI